MKYSALILGFFTALSAAAPTPGPDSIDLSQVAITDVGFAGTGCNAGTATVSPAQDYQTITFSFDSYEASIGPGIPFTQKAKNCNINLKIHYPQGWQYTLYTTDYSGLADLQGGITAYQESDYWFAGFVNQKATFKYTLVGPYTSKYTFTDTLASAGTVWSPCGAFTTLNINTQILLSSRDPAASGLFNTQVIDISVKTKYATKYGIRWQKCH